MKREASSPRRRARSKVRELTRRIVSLMLSEKRRGKNAYLIHQLRNRALRLRGAAWIETEE